MVDVLLTKKVVLPKYFSMQVSSPYGIVASDFFFNGGTAELLETVEAKIVKAKMAGVIETEMASTNYALNTAGYRIGGAVGAIMAGTLGTRMADAVEARITNAVEARIAGDVNARIDGIEDGQAKSVLSSETMVFHTGMGDVSVCVDVAENNQLLGANRSLSEFCNGYEPEIHVAIDLLTPKNAVLLDIGSNWGPISLQAALREDFAGKIFCLEPQKRAFDNLTQFIEALSLGEYIAALNIAASDQGGEATLVSDRWHGNIAVGMASVGGEQGAQEERVAHGEHGEYGGQEAHGEICRLVPLDDLRLPDPALIKIDVEGHEAKVLAGAKSLITRVRPFIIFEDWMKNGKSHYEMLAGLGYQFYFLGWFNPFAGQVVEKPPFMGNIQIFAMQQFAVKNRVKLPERINVLASPVEIKSLEERTG